MNTLIILIVVVILLVSIYININLYYKNSLLEKELQKSIKIEENAMTMYYAMLSLMVKTKREIDAIDKRETFSSDDEIGFAFKTINVSIATLVQAIKDLEKDDNDNDETTNQNQSTSDKTRKTS